MSSTTPIYVAIIDDDESLCRSLSRLMRAAGIQPIVYYSAEAFLADAKRPTFDCLVIDIQLGEISGIHLHRHLAAVGRNTPVIFITAQDDPETRQEAEAAGCVAFFRKSDSGAELLEAIRRLGA